MWINYANQIFEQPLKKSFACNRKLPSRHFFKLLVIFSVKYWIISEPLTCLKIWFKFKFHYKGNSIFYKLFNSHLGQCLLISPMPILRLKWPIIFRLSGPRAQYFQILSRSLIIGMLHCQLDFYKELNNYGPLTSQKLTCTSVTLVIPRRKFSAEDIVIVSVRPSDLPSFRPKFLSGAYL
jgi:hypothetical protein